MPTDLICADYPQLERIAQRFQQTSEHIQHLRQSVEKPLNRLKSGGWKGRGADQFYKEMDRLVIPAIVRLQTALTQAAQVTTRLSQRVRIAEEEAAALFKDGASAQPFTGGTANGDQSKVVPDTSYGTPVSNTVAPQQDVPDPPAVPDPTERDLLLSDINTLVGILGNYEDLVHVFPELAHLEQLSDDALAQLLEDLFERQYVLDILTTTLALYGKLDAPLPVGLERMTTEELRTLVHDDLQNIRYINAFSQLVLWAFASDPHTYTDVIDRFWQLSPEERFDFLHSLSLAMQHTADYEPGDYLNLSQLPPPVIVSPHEPSPELQSLLRDTVTRARELMALAHTDPETQVWMNQSFIATQFPDDSWGDWLSGLPQAAAMAAIIPPAGSRLRNLDIVGFERSNIVAVVSRFGSSGRRGIQRALRFIASLSDNGLRRLGQTFDIQLNHAVHNRLTQFQALSPEELRLRGFTDSEIRAPQIFRSDIEVAELADTGIVYGASRNVSDDHIGFEFEASGKPDPTLAIYAPTLNGYAEFDWYRYDGDQLVLIDPKHATMGGIYDLSSGSRSKGGIFADEALRQSEAAWLLGDNVRVEWVVPANVSDSFVTELQNYFEQDLLITNITVVRYAP